MIKNERFAMEELSYNDADVEETEPAVSHRQECKAFEKILQYLEQQDDARVSASVTINALLCQAAKK